MTMRFVLFFGLLLTASLVLAQKKPAPNKKPKEPTKEQKAAQLAEQAANDLKAGEYQKALEGFTTAYTLVPEEPGFLFNIGICYQNLKEYQKAKDSYLEFLEKAATDHPARPKADARLKAVEEELEKLKPPEPPSQPVVLPQEPVQEAPPPTPLPAKKTHKIFFGAAGVTGAGALGATTLLFLSISKGRAEEQAGQDATLIGDQTTASEHFSQMRIFYDRAKQLSPVADALWASTVGLGVVGLIVRPKKESSAALVISPSGVGASLQF